MLSRAPLSTIPLSLELILLCAATQTCGLLKPQVMYSGCNMMGRSDVFLGVENLLWVFFWVKISAMYFWGVLIQSVSKSCIFWVRICMPYIFWGVKFQVRVFLWGWNMKLHQPAVLCFHQFLSIWIPWGNTHTRIWSITWSIYPYSWQLPEDLKNAVHIKRIN